MNGEWMTGDDKIRGHRKSDGVGGGEGERMGGDGEFYDPLDAGVCTYCTIIIH